MGIRPPSNDTRRRPWIRGRAGGWILALILLAVAAGSVFVRDPTPFDLRIYRDAVRTMLDGAPVYGRGYGEIHLPFTYPPFALFPIVPFALAPLWVATAAWFVVSLGCLYAAAAICLRSIGRAASPAHAAVVGGLAAVILQPMRSTLDLGQINIVLLALVLADAFSVSSRRRGVLIGLAGAVKLTPLVFLAWLMVARDRAAAIRGAATFAVATALTWAVLPSDSARYWLHELFDPGRIGRLDDPLNQSLNGTVERLVGSGTLATVAWAVLAAVTLAVGVLSARRLTDRGFGLASLSAVAIAGLLASPVSWPHHWVWVFPATVAGWGLRRDRPVLAWASVALAAVTAISPWRLADVPIARDAWVIAGASWLLVALLGDRDRSWGAARRSGTAARAATA
jgi:alpha-1,2-mannosyltransferase